MKYEEFLESIKGVATQLSEIHRQIVALQEPVVDRLISTQSRDQQALEETLDRLLDAACCDAGLKQFRRLCRYYWTINPESTASYINAYREMWDRDDGEAGEADFGNDRQTVEMSRAIIQRRKQEARP